MTNGIRVAVRFPSKIVEMIDEKTDNRSNLVRDAVQKRLSKKAVTVKLSSNMIAKLDDFRDRNGVDNRGEALSLVLDRFLIICDMAEEEIEEEKEKEEKFYIEDWILNKFKSLSEED